MKSIFRKLKANESLIIACLQIYRELLSLVTFLRVHSNSKEVSYLPRQNTYPNLKTTCHIKLKFFLWTKPLENLLFAKYLISVTASLSWKDNKYYQLLFEQKRNFKINVCLMNQKAAMYLTSQFVDIYIYIYNHKKHLFPIMVAHATW